VADRGAPWRSTILATAWVATGLGSGVLGATWATGDLRADLALRPPILVMDLATLAQGEDPQAIGQSIAHGLNAARRLGEGGVLVLDAQAILGAPADLLLDPGKVPAAR
jgi:hypothetical protein